jgi:hypothetical protein
MNYLKRQGQASGATGPTHWEKWARRWVGVGRRDEMKNKTIKKIYRLTAEKLTKRLREYIKMFLMPRI